MQIDVDALMTGQNSVEITRTKQELEAFANEITEKGKWLAKKKIISPVITMYTQVLSSNMTGKR